MAVLGFMGETAADGIVFTVSDQTLRTITNWKWSGSARYSIHSRHMGNALTEFTGLDPDKITFDLQLLVEHGVDPMADIAKLWNWERTGKPVALTIGTHKYGRGRWNVISHDVDIQYTDRRGDIAGATVSVTLQEYLQTGQAIPGVWTYK